MNRSPFLLTSLLALAGCGGHSGGSGSPEGAASALVGSWSGTYRALDGSQSGTIVFTVARDRSATGADAGVSVTGTAQDSRYGAATVTGFVYDDPIAEGTPSGSKIGLTYASGGDDAYLGRPSIDGRGHLVGTLGRFLSGDGNLSTAFDLAPVAATR